MEKKCSVCKKSKPLDCFHIKKDGKFGRNSRCKDCRKIYHEEYYINNKNRVDKRNKEYNHQHREQLAKVFRQKYHSNIAFKIKHNLRRRLRHAIKGTIKEASAQKLLGCSVDELKLHLETKFVDGMSWSNYGEWHIDHIKPCSKFDLTKPSEQKKCFHYTNLQPLWAKENLSKSNKFI